MEDKSFTIEQIEYCRVKSEQGDPDSQYNLGVIYRDGLGVQQDYKESIKWFMKSSDLGHGYSKYTLGVMYQNGEGVPQDYKE